jgi:hypothetical protein
LPSEDRLHDDGAAAEEKGHAKGDAQPARLLIVGLSADRHQAGRKQDVEQPDGRGDEPEERRRFGR